jgi:S-DNA-T family DNA segregation ATPase FtsK/SpoIIIE
MARLRSYVADVEQVLGISGIRVLAPIPNTTMVGYEVPRKERKFPKVPNGFGFDLAIGQTIMGEPRRFDIRQAPHMLVAGASGSGKSVFLASMIEQINRISNVQIHLFDPKMVELAQYQSLPSVVEYQSDPDAIACSLMDIEAEMNSRYKRLVSAKKKNIADCGGIPYKFVIIDEYGDLMSKDINKSILVLAQKARAAGIHLIIATQRPSVDVITGTIKANFPTKAVFRTAKLTDSKVVIDEAGAETLTGKGDMLFASDAGIERLQGYCI